MTPVCATRTCRVCGEEKPEGEFYQRRLVCRDCTNARRRERYAARVSGDRLELDRLRDGKRAWRARRRRENPLPEKACRECGRAFRPLHGNQAYCTPYCFEKHKYETRRDLKWRGPSAARSAGASSL